MNKFSSKSTYILVGVIVALIIVIVVSVGVKSMDDRASLKKADEIAATYQSNIDAYKKAADAELQNKATSVNSAQTASDFAVVVDTKVNSMPVLAKTGYGDTHSDAYKKAAAQRNEVKKSYEDLSRYTKENVAATYKYLDAVQGMLNMKVSDYLAGAQVTNGAPIREKLIPPYQSAYDALMKVPVPEDQAVLAKNAKDTYANFIASAKDAANKLDAKESFSFDFSKQLGDLQNQVNVARAAIPPAFIAQVTEATK